MACLIDISKLDCWTSAWTARNLIKLGAETIRLRHRRGGLAQRHTPPARLSTRESRPTGGLQYENSL